MNLLISRGQTASLISAILSINSWIIPTVATTYYSDNNFLQINNPKKACSLKPFTYELRRYGQIFKGAIYPNLTLIPCSRYEPVASFGGKFRMYKTTGDNKEACLGSVAIKFNNFGNMLDVTFVNRGSLPDNYCRDKNKTLQYRLYQN